VEVNILWHSGTTLKNNKCRFVRKYGLMKLHVIFWNNYLHNFKANTLCLRVCSKSFMLSSLAFTCVAFVAGALAFWAPLYMMKSMQYQQIESADRDT